MLNEDDEENPEDQTHVILDLRKSQLDIYENILGNFTTEIAEDPKRYDWDHCAEENSEYICAFHERKIDNVKHRIYSRVTFYELKDRSKLFFGEIISYDILIPTQFVKKQKKIYQKKMPTKKTNFKYNRARNNFVGKRYTRT